MEPETATGVYRYHRDRIPFERPIRKLEGQDE
jgi:hypothetical protein